MRCGMGKHRMAGHSGGLVLLALAAVVASATSARADPPPCDQVCWYDTPCDWECLPDPYEPWISTCGDWGRCESYCQPQWEREVGTEHRIGRRFQWNFWNPFD